MKTVHILVAVELNPEDTIDTPVVAFADFDDADQAANRLNAAYQELRARWRGRDMRRTVQTFLAGDEAMSFHATMAQLLRWDADFIRPFYGVRRDGFDDSFIHSLNYDVLEFGVDSVPFAS